MILGRDGDGEKVSYGDVEASLKHDQAADQYQVRPHCSINRIGV